MASEEAEKLAAEIVSYLFDDYPGNDQVRRDAVQEVARRTATAITAARAETWKEAIMFVNIADIGDAAGADATYKIGKMLEAAAGSKTKVFSREDEPESESSVSGEIEDEND